MEIKLSINKQPANIYIAGAIKRFMNREVKLFSHIIGISITIKELLATLQLILIFFVFLIMINSMNWFLIISGSLLQVCSFAIFKCYVKKGGIA
jgi:hypothetical protein